MKRILIAGSMIALLMQPAPSVAEAAATTPVFKDLTSTHWAASTIYDLVNYGYMKGYEDGTFKPNQFTTRGEAVVIIARTMGIDLTTDYKPKFQDVNETHPYYKVISKLAEIGVIADGTYFYPNAPLKRSEISKIIALAYGVEVDNQNKSAFKDLASNFWAKAYIESLADVEIIKGFTATTFEPNQYVTRAQIALLAKRGMAFKGQVEKLEVAYDYLQKDYISTVNAYKEWENKILVLVNDIRVKNNLAKLELDPQLTQIAIIKAKDMVKRNYFDHYSPFYGNPWDLATLFDYEYTSFGENIARNFTAPEETVTAWMESPKHRANILKSSYTHMGIGIEKAKNGKYYLVQDFSSK
ncbi:S-layer protein [Lysinibacillus sp. 2017]|uniref:CAP and S-layer homology domain-containing protein n=1 Tax=unclassified Lysinibacillus TaxID=2636778 RepID=UPI000D527EFC|nr:MULTISPECIES: S-layer homology domain-containing protein [unclassified Lysinibacillus]AWE06358.1 S-layer protein [Lysinibacillus sp. 2017]TGN31164.1 S-layer protein [Lysinibacillus sp. S2017]